jgi:hypothetical protein
LRRFNESVNNGKVSDLLRKKLLDIIDNWSDEFLMDLHHAADVSNTARSNKGEYRNEPDSHLQRREAAPERILFHMYKFDATSRSLERELNFLGST